MGRNLTIVIALVLGACAAEAPGEPGDHDEPADFEEVPAGDGKADSVPAAFNQNTVLSDALFLDATSMDATDMQEFLDNTPYGTKSWLATHTVEGVTAAQMIVDAARAENINPLLLLTRMQVEATLVSKTTTPSQTRINSALGCACPDNRPCAGAFRGLAAQLRCGANTLRRWYDGSVDATGAWKKNVAKKTLDPKTVTPSNHATASLYAYTPWVLTGRGGNWLVWNVTRKYVRHAEDTGLIPTP